MTTRRFSQQLAQKSKSITSRVNNRDIIDFIMFICTQLRIFIETQPNIPIDTIQAIYSLRESEILTNDSLSDFQKSQKRIHIIPVYNDYEHMTAWSPHISMYFKYGRRVYLIILKAKWENILSHFNKKYKLLMKDQQLYLKWGTEENTKERDAIADNMIKNYKDLQNMSILFAMPITKGQTW